MSFLLVKALNASDPAAIELPVSSLAVTINSLYCADRTNGVVVAVTSSVGTSITSLWVAAETTTSSATVCDFVPVLSSQIWRASCTADTASNQLMKRHDPTDKDTVDNTSTDDTSTNGIIEALFIIGAASDRLLGVRFLEGGQVTA